MGKQYTVNGKQYTVKPLTVIERQQAFKDALIEDAFEQIEATDPSKGRKLAGAKRVEAGREFVFRQIEAHEFDFRGPMQAKALDTEFGANIAMAISLADVVSEWPELLPHVKKWRESDRQGWEDCYAEVGLAAGFFIIQDAGK